jgi:hypothetical protein
MTHNIGIFSWQIFIYFRTVIRSCIILLRLRIRRSVPVILDRTSDSEPATGHQFFCLKHEFAISKYFHSFLAPQ